MTAPSVLDPGIFRYLDVFKCIMLREHSNTLLPDLAEALGNDALPKFLALFEGTTFRVPPRALLEAAARDAAIYSEVQKVQTDAEKVEMVARRHGVSVTEAMAIHQRVRRAVEEVLGG